MGTLARNAPFDVYAWVEGPRCRKGLEGKWAELERGGFVCLKHASATTEDLGVVPKLEGDQIVGVVTKIDLIDYLSGLAAAPATTPPAA